MSRRLRVLQTAPNKYVIQEKRIFIWKDLDEEGFTALDDTEFEDWWTKVYTNESDAIEAANSFLREDSSRQTFKPRVVWNT